MNGCLWNGAWAGVLIVGLTPCAAAAQDVVLRGEIDGTPVPAAYFDDIRRTPDLYSFAGPGWAAPRLEVQDALTGTLPILVLPALFSDSPDPHISQGELQRLLFDGPAEHGTLTEFYRELSGGRLEVTGQVAPWVRTHLTLLEVTAGEAGFGPDARVFEWLIRAIQEADLTIDFGQFDNDGPDGVPNSGDDDGVVDAVAFEFLEVSGSCGGPGIWPHRSSIRFRNEGVPFQTADLGPQGPIGVDAYMVQSVSNCGGREPQTANVIGHEMGHILGLPDLYHPIEGILPTERRWVVGCWGLMAAGSWGCGDPSRRVEAFGPIRMSPWSLDQLGWVEFEDVGYDERYREFALEPTIRGGRPLRIPLGQDGRESIVLEYRLKEGFDEPLPGQGLLAYRWNLDGVLRPPQGDSTPYLFRVLEGDGNQELVQTHRIGGNRGEANDLLSFPGNSPVLSAVTSPSTDTHSGDPTTTTIHRFDVSGPVARVWISTAREPGVILLDESAPSVSSPYIQFHRIGGGTPPYEITLRSGPPWLAVQAVGDRLDLTGVPESEGSAQLTVDVADAEGRAAEWTHTLQVGPFNVAVDRIAGSLMENGVPVTPREAEVLDLQGNQNGSLDLGDMRAFLRSR
ncbi:MAG: immune inhibitor A domain-containing protein [Longimicrobiales bacterium]